MFYLSLTLGSLVSNLLAWYLFSKIDTKALSSKPSPECPAERLDSQQHQAS